MGARMKRQAGLWAVSLLSVGTLVTAAAPDLRLVNAAAEQDRPAVRALIKEGVNVNAARADGVTALLWAAHWDDLETVDLLLRGGANVNAADDHGVTALARASENGRAAMVEKLLAAGGKANAAQDSGLTPLMIAARTGNVQVVKALLAHGANLNASTHTGVTPLMWAVAAPHPDVVRVLIEGRANVHVSTNKGYTPLMFAARNGDIDMAKILIAAGVNVNEPGSDGTHALPFSIIGGYDEFALFLIERGADPNSSMDGVRALHAAAGNVNTWLGDWYRRHGDDRGFGNSNRDAGLDPTRRLTLVKALVARGADPNTRITASAMFMSYIGYPKKGAFEPFACGTGDLQGATPVWVAAYAANGNVGGFGGDGGRGAESATRVDSSAEIIRALLAAGGDQHLTTDDGTTPLMVAAGLGRSTFSPGLQRGRRSPSAEEAVKVLLAAGANIHAVNEADFTVLHGAAFRGLNEVIQILVEKGADINARDFRGRTPYRLAEGSKQSFQFQAYPQTAEFIKTLGANTRLGVPGTVHERLRDVGAAVGAAEQP